MEDNLLDRNSNLNLSGFDDSIISDIEEPNGRDSDNILLKTNSKLDKRKQNNYNQNNIDILSPDAIMFNKKNKSDERVMIEDIFSDKFEIPMSIPSKFSISKMGRQFIYESKTNSNIINYKIDSRKFGLSRNTQISTYLLSLFIFSEFLNLEEIENDKRLKVIFLKKNKTQKKFIIEDNISFLKILEMPEDTVNDFDLFINGINGFLSEKDYLNIQKKNKKTLISAYALITLIILLLMGIFAAMYFTIKDINEKKDFFFGECILLVILIIGLIIKIIDAKNLKILFMFYELRYLILNYNRFYEYIEIWNKNLFENYKITVSIPISLNYIMFNLDPYQNIEIKHLDLNWMKKKFYKSQNALFKNEKEEKLFNAINQNISILKRRNSLVIN